MKIKLYNHLTRFLSSTNHKGLIFFILAIKLHFYPVKHNFWPIFYIVLKTPFNIFCSYIASTGLVIIEAGTRIHYISTTLPQGEKSKDYNVTIKAEISDGQSSHMDILIVKVRLCNKVQRSSRSCNTHHLALTGLLRIPSLTKFLFL